MKRYLFILLLSAGCVQQSTEEKTTYSYDQLYRPQFHFSPPQNFMNDPNGLVYANGTYHLFYQHNPMGNQWGHMSWGHATSRDLVHWKHQPVALEEDEGVMIFSGSAVYDQNNTSGFDNDDEDEGVLVAIYTAHQENLQNQAIAYSNDGIHWTKYKDNPVLDQGLKDFRDPKVFWYDPDQKWVMVVAVPDQQKVQLYESGDLKHWGLMSEFGWPKPENVIWECPDLYPLKVRGASDEFHWVMHVSLGGKGVENSPRMMYFIGEFNGQEFTTSQPQDTIRWLDHGRDFYAAITWNDAPLDQAHQIAIGWVNNWKYANQLPVEPWRGAQSIPRHFTLEQEAEGLRLFQTPVDNLRRLRTDSYNFEEIVIDESEFHFDGDTSVYGRQLELFIEFSSIEADAFGVKLFLGGETETIVAYDAKNESFFVDRTNSGQMDYSDAIEPVSLAPLKKDDGKIRMHVFIDHSIVEAFGNDGEVVITSRVFPAADKYKLVVFAEGGKVQIDRLQLWKLKSIW